MLPAISRTTFFHAVALRTVDCFSHHTFIVTKIFVGIYRTGGVVFNECCCPSVHFHVFEHDFDSFLGRLDFGGRVDRTLHDARWDALLIAYNDAVQVLVLRSTWFAQLLTIYGLIQVGGWGELKALCGSDMLNLWKPLVPAGVEGSWAPVYASQEYRWRHRQGGLVFQWQIPWLGAWPFAPRSSACGIGGYARPIHRATENAGRAQ